MLEKGRIVHIVYRKCCQIHGYIITLIFIIISTTQVTIHIIYCNHYTKSWIKLKKLFCLPLPHNSITAAKFKSKMETILETLETELSAYRTFSCIRGLPVITELQHIAEQGEQEEWDCEIKSLPIVTFVSITAEQSVAIFVHICTHTKRGTTTSNTWYHAVSLHNCFL